MRLLRDENVKRSLYVLLQQEGYRAARVQTELEAGCEDVEIVDHCRDHGHVLLTNDDDFFTFDDHPGVLFLTEQSAPPRRTVTAIRRVEEHVGPDSLAGRVAHVPDGWA